MTSAKWFLAGVMVTALAAAGCGTASPTKAAPPEGGGDKKDADHVAHGNGPNGGVTFDMGKYHAEFTVDHPKKEVTLLFIKSVEGKKEKDWPTEAVAATEFTLSIKATKVKEGADKGKVVPPMTITLKAVDAKDGKASKFVGTDPGVGNVADFEGVINGAIDGVGSKGEFKE